MDTTRRALQVLLALTATIGTAGAQVITVDISDASIIDVDPNTATVTDLPGPDGHICFSEALIASNNTPGRQTIGFAIPTSDWTYLAWYYPGRAVVHGGYGFQAYDEVTVDGGTQTAFTGDTNPNGGEVVLMGPLNLLTDDCTVRGLDSSSVAVVANNGLIEGNTATGIELVFGSSNSLVRNNTGGYIQIDRSNNNVVVGNTVQRVRVLGWFGGGLPATNNRIGGPTLAERNYITGLGTWNSQGWPSGFAVQLFNAVGTVIENNWIGTTPDGLQQGHQATTAGIFFDDENYDTTIRGNRIAGILGHKIGTYPGVLGTAISIGGFGSGIQIVGNTIGLDANGAPSLGSVTGIGTANYYLGPVQNVVIGGPNPGDGNEIAGHLNSAVSVANTLSGVRISGNSIHDNAGLGIDLINNAFQTGVTPNDPLDADTGGNELQNYPVLQSATSAGPTLHVVGMLNSTPSSTFRVEFFASPQCDAAGFGEGRNYVGSTTVATNSSGDVAFNATLPATVQLGWVVTSTTTRVASASTSEFSACTPVVGATVITYCTAKTNSLGCVPHIGSSGTPSLSDASPFVITAQQVLNAKNGILFYGSTGPTATPFLGGTLCAHVPIKRTPLQNSGGTPPPASDCSGIYHFDFDAWFAAGIDPALALGAILDAQFWSRDPSSSAGAGLTNAIEFAVTL